MIDEPPGHVNFSIVSAMGVITDGAAGTEMAATYARLEKLRGVVSIRADTATLQSVDRVCDAQISSCGVRVCLSLGCHLSSLPQAVSTSCVAPCWTTRGTVIFATSCILGGKHKVLTDGPVCVILVVDICFGFRAPGVRSVCACVVRFFPVCLLHMALQKPLKQW